MTIHRTHCRGEKKLSLCYTRRLCKECPPVQRPKKIFLTKRLVKEATQWPNKKGILNCVTTNYFPNETLAAACIKGCPTKTILLLVGFRVRKRQSWKPKKKQGSTYFLSMDLFFLTSYPTPWKIAVSGQPFTYAQERVLFKRQSLTIHLPITFVRLSDLIHLLAIGIYQPDGILEGKN